MTSYIFEENKHMGLNMCSRIKKSTKMGEHIKINLLLDCLEWKNIIKSVNLKGLWGKKANNQSQIKIKLKLDNKNYNTNHKLSRMGNLRIWVG